MSRQPESALPDLTPERALAAEYGVSCVAGVDEAGRGALAGPVFAAAVLLPLESDTILEALAGVRDSKLLTQAARERLFPVICDCASTFGIGSASARPCPRLNADAMNRARAASSCWPTMTRLLPHCRRKTARVGSLIATASPSQADHEVRDIVSGSSGVVR